MKLQRTGESAPKLRSQDALLPPETKTESDFFDPRVDFPAQELRRLKALAGDMGQRIQALHAPKGLLHAWWLSLVDAEFKDLLFSDPEFEDALKAEYDRYYSYKVGTPFLQADDLLVYGLPHVQLFPSLRSHFRNEYSNKALPRILGQNRSASRLYEVSRYLVALIQLYPEHRDELLTAYSVTPDDVVQRLKQDLGDHSVIVYRPQLVANILLVFPELRPQILALLHGQEQWVKKCKSARQPFNRESFELGFYLTIIGAEDARITENGNIELHLKPLPPTTTSHPLPDRPLA